MLTHQMPVSYTMKKNIKGNQVILQNRGGHYGKIDLELLFNGVTNRSEQLLEVLKSDK